MELNKQQNHINFFILFFLLILNKAVVCQNECEPRIIRLLIGEKYSDQTSKFTGTLMYQTYNECPDSGIKWIINNDTFSNANINQYETEKETIHSVWNDKFCHNTKKNCEQVVYNQYIHTIRIAVPTSTPFTYTFCSNLSSPQSACLPAFTSILPPLPMIISKKTTSFLKKQVTSNSNNITPTSTTPLKILFFGDHDLSNPGQITFNSIFKTMETNKFDAFIFLGDYGYEFYQNNGQVGDDYLNMLTRINTVAPMAITSGNHEDNYDFQFFNEKFRMPSYNLTHNNYYSFEIGNVHFISLNLHYFNDQVNPPDIDKQKAMLEWVESDLRKVDRNVTPWIIAFGHKMIYCKGSDCEDFATDYSQFDTILNKYKVDLFISGHKHKFQVMKPIKNGKPGKYDINSINNTISNYDGFITIIQGNGGTSKNDDTLELLMEESTPNNFLHNLSKNNLFNNDETPFDKTQQKKSMLYESDNLGYGILNILDNHSINILSIDSKTNQACYEININK